MCWPKIQIIQVHHQWSNWTLSFFCAAETLYFFQKRNTMMLKKNYNSKVANILGDLFKMEIFFAGRDLGVLKWNCLKYVRFGKATGSWLNNTILSDFRVFLIPNVLIIPVALWPRQKEIAIGSMTIANKRGDWRQKIWDANLLNPSLFKEKTYSHTEVSRQFNLHMPPHIFEPSGCFKCRK